MMEMQFFGGEERCFKSVNYMICKDGDVSIYAEVEVPQKASSGFTTTMIAWKMMQGQTVMSLWILTSKP